MVISTYLDRIKLSAFRNYGQLGLSLDGRHVVLSGPNGSSKTNLIEAVSLLSPGRGLRRASSAQMIHKDGASEGFSVFAALINHEDTYEIGTGSVPSSPGEPISRARRVRINGTTAKSSDELLDLCRIIWLTPSMDGLFTGPASDRRRFLDRMVLAIDPGHGQRANAYERAMRQRNKLLEDSAGQLRTIVGWMALRSNLRRWVLLSTPLARSWYNSYLLSLQRKKLISFRQQFWPLAES